MDYHEYELCQSSHFTLLSNDTFYDTSLNLLKNQNASIGGFYDAQYTKYLALNIKICRNSSNSNIIGPTGKNYAYLIIFY